jgi:phage terminase large subunit GpA-like protein
VFKSELYRALRLDPPTDEELAAGAAWPKGYVHLPRSIDAERVKQLVAEQLVTVKTRRGFDKLEWQKLRARNEVLDCRVYARAAAWLAGIDRWPERKWRELEAQVQPAAQEAADEPDDDAPAPTAGRLVPAPRRGRRVFRSSYLS